MRYCMIVNENELQRTISPGNVDLSYTLASCICTLKGHYFSIVVYKWCVWDPAFILLRLRFFGLLSEKIKTLALRSSFIRKKIHLECLQKPFEKWRFISITTSNFKMCSHSVVVIVIYSLLRIGFVLHHFVYIVIVVLLLYTIQTFPLIALLWPCRNWKA